MLSAAMSAAALLACDCLGSRLIVTREREKRKNNGRRHDSPFVLS